MTPGAMAQAQALLPRHTQANNLQLRQSDSWRAEAQCSQASQGWALHCTLGSSSRRTRGGARLRVQCSSAAEPVSTTPPSAPGSVYTPSSGTVSMNALTATVNALFSFQPFFQFAASQARNMMVKRGDAIGYPWAPRLEELRRHDWDAELAAIAASSRVADYPAYYLQPFHAYEAGNLCLDAALEVELAARAVHASVFDPQRKALDTEGDAKLRRGYHAAMKPFLRENPKTILDMGCATGLSTLALYEDFPEAESLQGVDLSPYFLAVANFNMRQMNQGRQKPLPLSFSHAAAESTGLPDASVDLVSMCLVCHELPRYATKQIIAEAFRVLRPGGAFSIMEMNPASPALQAMVNNVFAFTAFKATEPYFDDYRTFPIEDAIAEQGFEYPQVGTCSPRHKAIVAHKPK